MYANKVLRLLFDWSLVIMSPACSNGKPTPEASGDANAIAETIYDHFHGN